MGVACVRGTRSRFVGTGDVGGVLDEPASVLRGSGASRTIGDA